MYTHIHILFVEYNYYVSLIKTLLLSNELQVPFVQFKNQKTVQPSEIQ